MSETAKCRCGRRIHENFGDWRMSYGRYNHVDDNGQRDSKHYWHKAEPAEPAEPVAVPPAPPDRTILDWVHRSTVKECAERIARAETALSDIVAGVAEQENWAQATTGRQFLYRAAVAALEGKRA